MRKKISGFRAFATRAKKLFFPLCRATVIPPSTSPKEMWELDITGPADKTQYGSPFKTRERRKLERQQKK